MKVRALIAALVAAISISATAQENQTNVQEQELTCEELTADIEAGMVSLVEKAPSVIFAYGCFVDKAKGPESFDQGNQPAIIELINRCRPEIEEIFNSFKNLEDAKKAMGMAFGAAKTVYLCSVK